MPIQINEDQRLGLHLITVDNWNVATRTLKNVGYQENWYTKLKILTNPDILVKNLKILMFFLTFAIFQNILTNPDSPDIVDTMSNDKDKEITAKIARFLKIFH